MATLVLTVVGTVLGGPLGGAIGAAVGSQVDAAIMGGRSAEGPRLKDLTLQTSSYGAPLPLHFGQMRAAGTVIWATEMRERRETQGGGKGSPSVTSYSYTASFAVALASRPIVRVGRVWADGNLLRGTTGRLKVSGKMRVHTGHGDQQPDPLIAQAEGASRVPAFRHTAYVVFEDLALGDFGNRIPSLTFEIFADEGGTTVSRIVDSVLPEARYKGAPRLLGGFTIDRGTAAATIQTLGDAFPLGCAGWGDGLEVCDGETVLDQPLALPEPVLPTDDAEGGRRTGTSIRRSAQPRARSCGLRYYDIGRDYQPGLQRGHDRPEPGEPLVIELPAALDATAARTLAETAGRRLSRAVETALYRIAGVDARYAPGRFVTAPELDGVWRIDQWELQADGVLLHLWRLTGGGPSTASAADAGRINPAPDYAPAPTVLCAFELPWDGSGSSDTPSLWVVGSAENAGWSGAALFLNRASAELLPLGSTGRRRAVVGTALSPLAAANPLLIDCGNALVVQLAAPDLTLADASFAQLAGGANRALIGREVIQFATAFPLGAGKWRLEQLWRGRGGTEQEIAGHREGETFVLLDDAPVRLDPQTVGDAATATLVASGLGDASPVLSGFENAGITRRPFSPVHGRYGKTADGGAHLRWIRRARGSVIWPDEVEVPLNEQAESWDVQAIAGEAVVGLWRTAVSSLSLTPAEMAALPLNTVFEIRQVGSLARSPALRIAAIFS